jgi:hypothetical protein
VGCLETGAERAVRGNVSGKVGTVGEPPGNEPFNRA